MFRQAAVGALGFLLVSVSARRAPTSFVLIGDSTTANGFVFLVLWTSEPWLNHPGRLMTREDGETVRRPCLYADTSSEVHARLLWIRDHRHAFVPCAGHTLYKYGQGRRHDREFPR
jgi:hypothetical protein